jgi:hypothetical protein
MNRTSRLISVLSFASALVPAQEAPAPAAELSRLQVFVGHWQGSGEAQMVPGQPKTKWTCESVYGWALNEHFLQADTTIVFEGHPTPMQFREYLGWDREHRRYVTLAANNMGEAAVNTAHFVGQDVVVGMMLWTRQGKPEFERAWTKYGKDSMTMSITFLGTDGPAVEGVTGTFQRVDKANPRPLDSVPAMMGAPPEMARIARMVGDFDVAGSMVMMPGTPKMDIRGRDAIRPLFGGALVQVSTRGEPDYRAEAFYSWDHGDGCYRLAYVNNMGQVGSVRCWFTGDSTFVGVGAGPMAGVPTAKRILLHLDEKGRPKRVVGHGLVGDAEPYQSFSADYVPAK